MKYYLLYILHCAVAAIIMSSCSPTESGEQVDHPILKVGDITETSLSDICTSIEFIPLETNSESLIRQLVKVVPFEDKYYIFDKGLYTLSVFDKKGQFLSKIHRIGQGPGEYTMLYDFQLDEKQRVIELLDPMGRILTYDFAGNFIESTHLPSPPYGYQNFFYLNDSTYAFYSFPNHEQECPITYVSKQNTMKNSYNDFKHTDPLVSSFALTCYKYNDAIYLSEGISDDVYELVDSSYVVAYEWDFGHKMNNFMHKIKSTVENQNDIIYEYFEAFGENPANFSRGMEFQTDRYYYTVVERGKIKIVTRDRNYRPELYNVFYEKGTEKVHYFKQTKEGLEFIVIHMEEDYCIAYLNPDCIQEVLSRGKIKNLGSLRNRTEDDNPILVRLNF